MSADELARIIAGWPRNAVIGPDREASARVIRAGYAKPRTVTTVDELIALPVDTIVREVGGAQYTWEKYGIDTTGNGEDEWYRMGWDGTFNPDEIRLPVIVIFEGTES